MDEPSADPREDRSLSAGSAGNGPELREARPWRTALLKFLWVGLISFGAGRWIYLHSAFVRNGWIREEVFLHDLAFTQVLPGAQFVNLIVLCGMRVRSVWLGVAGLALAVFPGALLMVLAMVYLSGGDARLAGAVHGILVGAVGVLLATFTRLFRAGVRGSPDVAFVVATFLLSIAGVPLLVTIPVVAAVAMRWFGARTSAA